MPTLRQERAQAQFARGIEYRFEPLTKWERQFRHGHWEARCARVAAALESTGGDSLRLDHFVNCGSGCVAEWSETEQRHRLAGNYCHDRHCEPCMRAKANKIAGNLRDRLEAKPHGRYRFITLTLKHSTAPLADQIRRIYKHFKALRATQLCAARSEAEPIHWSANSHRTRVPPVGQSGTCTSTSSPKALTCRQRS